jgi:hypothetical protein
MSTRRLHAGILALLCALAGGLAFASAPALGFLLHPYLSQITEANGAPLGAPQGLALDAEGNLFALHAFNGNGLPESRVVDVFDSANAFTSQFSVVPNTYIGGRSVAVSDATGDVYVAEDGAYTPSVEVFKPEGGGKYTLLQKRPIPESGSYLAIDNSSGPRAGDLFVVMGILPYGAPAKVEIIKTNEEGVLEETGEELPPPPEGFRRRGGSLAIDRATGKVYIPTLEDLVGGAFAGVVEEYNSQGVYQGQLVGSSGFAPEAVAIEESTGDLYVVTQGDVEQFNASGKYIGVIDQTPAGVLPGAVDVVVNAGGDVYVSSGGVIDIFGPAGSSVPYVSTGGASVAPQTRTVAKLEGVVNPEGEEVTSCQFEYGTSTAYGHTAACAPAPGSGSGAVEVSAEVSSGLAVGATYYYRLVAANKNGVDPGLPGTFTTVAAVPGLQTEAASGIEQPAAGTIVATLNGSLEPDGADTHYYFEYGETEAYGSVTPAVDAG